MFKKKDIAGLSLFLLFSASAAWSPVSASPANNSILINGERLDYPVWHKMLMPGDVLAVQFPDGFQASVNEASIETEWKAPSNSGNYVLKITNGHEQIARVTIFVLEPSTNVNSEGYLGDYRIGKYPRNTPPGFIKLNKGDGNLSVSPSFKVGQFLCKQQPKVWPKYLIVSEDNLERLETLLGDLNEQNLTDADTLFVMSGYRTPFYNAAIGSAKFSRHMYGDAADVYIDTKPRDGVMDDINGDGQITKADANFIYDYSQDLFDAEDVVSGGIGSYKANAVHGPFVHIDARGTKARWGR